VSQPLIYVDSSDVRAGALDELKEAIEELVVFIEANEPQLIAYGVYLSDDGHKMTVVHVHASPASLDHHLDVAGPAFRRFRELLRLSSIRVYGEPSEWALGQLRAKAELLGCADVSVYRPHAGFGRIAAPE